ncbi:suppressor of fused domain protein [Alteraurantiacibacter buctensis]|uniref:Suppressor of fused-like domain-containing protein n=1 Tax=Alteraurantiacibacter buctensis TaxID=1503981 RepID=A0A844YU57_9SPHN|nr:suppressor of fused domain protein [Alteraurantiacibacter buctensis]MXO70401.1 hypothetical protein [Alteraurantiacibacter buctensis]
MSGRPPGDKERAIGRYIRSKFGSDTSVHRYADDSGDVDLFLVSGRDCPVAGVTSFGTVGLALYPFDFHGSSLSVELLGACSTITEGFDRVISSCAIECMKNGTSLPIESIVPDVISQYGLSDTMRHIVLTSPFLWEGFETALSLDALTVHWLMAVPISDSEMRYCKTSGFENLEAEFLKHQIDVFDLSRPSVI